MAGTGLEDFRAAVASHVGAEAAATYPSFRVAICACLRALASNDPDSRAEVLIPAYACPDFYAAIEGAGLDVARCDVDPATLAIDLDSAKSAIGEDTLAMIAVNHLGFGNPMDALVDICADEGIALVEDLGYSLGTRYRGRPLGAFGDGAVLNFKEGKAIPVGGGMVTSNRAWLDVSDDGRGALPPNLPVLFGYRLLAPPLAYGQFRRVASLLQACGVDGSEVSTHPESTRDTDYVPPYATMSAFQGGVGARVFDRLGDHRRHRAEVAAYYEERLAPIEGVSVVRPTPDVSNVQYVRYPILVEGESRRDEVRAALREAGIGTAALYRSLSIGDRAHPGSERVRREIVTLPTHPYVTAADRRRTVETIEGVLAGA